MGSSPTALALSGNRLYVANTGSNTVSVINTDTYKRIDANPSWFSQDISVGSSPSALALGTGGRLYVANRASNTVSVINTTTNTLVDTNPNTPGTQSISVGSSPTAMALGDGRLYVANRGSNTVSVINTSSYSVINTITVGSQPAGLALGGDGRLYVANTASNTVSVIDTATNTLIDTNPNTAGIDAISVSSSPSSVALSPDGGLAYVANGNDTVSVIDTKDYTVLSTVAIDSDTTGGHVIAVSPNGTVYVTDTADNTVRVLTINRGNTAPIASSVTVIGHVTLTGSPSGPPVMSADGSRAVITTTVTDANGTTTRVAVINPATGTQTGTTLTGNSSGSPVISADGSRALDITIVSDPSTGTTETQVAVINTTTGAQVGTTVTLTGSPSGPPLISADWTRALITTTDGDWTTGFTTRVAVIDTTSGTQTGTTITLAGFTSGTPQLSADGSRALITAYDRDANNVDNAHVAVINTANGTQTFATLTFAGQPQPSASVLLGADGSRALINVAVYDGRTSTSSTRVSVINTTTGTQIGTTTTLTGYQASGPTLLSPDGSRAVISATSDDWATRTSTTRVAVINTTTGTQTGTTLALTGYGYSVMSADGNRAVITTDGPTGAQVAVINTTTGARVGTTLTLTGYGLSFSPLMSANGNRALITTRVYNYSTRSYTTRVTVLRIV